MNSLRAPRWLSSDRLSPSKVLVWLVVAHIVLKVAVFPLVMHAEPLGDESAYLNGARALSNLVRDLFGFTTPDMAEVRRNVVASGWFMPGMSVLIAPIYLVAPEAPIWLVRAYIGVMTLALFLLVIRSVARRLGPGWACVLLVLPGLIPSWIVFTYGAWGDLCAGLVLMLLLMKVLEVARELRRGEAPSIRQGVALGLTATAVLYLRSSTSVLIAGLFVILLIAAGLMLRGRIRWRAAGSLTLACLMFILLLAPWSVLATSTLEGRVITTTTVPTVMANTFGERDQVCFGPCDPDSTLWFRPVRYSRELARATGVSEVEALQVMSDHALREVTGTGYVTQVVRNLGAYTLNPNSFTTYLKPEDGRGSFGRVGEQLASWVTWMLYAPLMLLGLVSLLFVVRRSLEARLLDVLVKLSLGALLVQPFVHIAGARYWSTAGPLLAIAAVSFLRERQISLGLGKPISDGVVTERDRTIVRWLGRVQLLLVILTAAVLAVLVLVPMVSSS